ncbi:unnamed protein product [Meganyctiphanes norvegica]|uniref:Uncharacterized protein n=1 Tax=Meganyctiphanes norvegica TaxID=48144 RepID=A0AAV2SGH3_MEGNR
MTLQIAEYNVFFTFHWMSSGLPFVPTLTLLVLLCPHMCKLPAILICQIFHYKVLGFGHCRPAHSTLYAQSVLLKLTEGTVFVTLLDDHKLWIHIFNIMNWAC